MIEKLHKALHRQLTRAQLSEGSLPTDLAKWQRFLESINRSYHDSDQERYLLERSMEISSREMKDLNSKLEEAQHLALLGYWHHDQVTGENFWSKELYRMFKLDFGKPVPTLDKMGTLVHPDDLPKINKLVNKAFTHGEKFEIELRIQSLDEKKDYRWYYMIAHPKVKEGETIHRLSGVTMDITERKIAEQEVTLLQQQLVTSARRAGMADVATSILHNVGNVLNSINVSINLVTEYLGQSDFTKLLNAENMLIDNKANLSEFLIQNEKGKLILPYLVSYTAKLQNNYHLIDHEIKNLARHIEHVKAITEMQKSLSGVGGVLEKVYVPEMIDAGLNMCGNVFEKDGILLSKEFEDIPFITTDKTKLLQILVNLLQNARDALSENKIPGSKKIAIHVKRLNDAYIQIQIIDNGIGIDQENLIKIFSFGFTTKRNGHGFGLHSSAIAAKEIGGKLEAVSLGRGQGAAFNLTLPMIAATRRASDEHQPELTSHRN